jgi:putative membrane protein
LGSKRKDYLMKFAFPLAATAALALAACGSSEEPAPMASDTPTGALAEADAAASATAALPTDAQGFVDMASASDMYEIEAGKLAQQMGQSQAVKDFGQMMETDHTKSTADLKAAAAQVDGVTVAPRLDPKQQSDLDALRAAGDDFDSVYKAQQVTAHTQALALLRNFAAAGEAQPLKDFASKTAPVVETHFGHAQDLP